MTTKIYGESDDLLEFEGTIYGEVSQYDTPITIKAITKNKQKLTFTFKYHKDGAWRFKCKDHTDEELINTFNCEIHASPKIGTPQWKTRKATVTY